MKQIIFLLMFTSFSMSTQKTKPTTVKFNNENNTTAISFKKEKDFILPGKWEKYQETVNQWKYYLKNGNSSNIGVGKLLQKKIDFYKENMTLNAFLVEFMEVVKKGLTAEKCSYSFEVLNDNENDDFSFYSFSSIACGYATINLVEIKKGIVYDLSALVDEGKESEMKSLLLQLYNEN